MKHPLPLLFLALSLCAVPLVAQAQPELKGTPEELREFLHPEGRHVRIEGEAELKAYSDRAIVSLLITTEDRLLSKAIAANTELRETIAAQLTAEGIAANDIKSSRFSTSPQYGWFGDKPKTFEVVNRMAVRIATEAHLGAIAAVADANPEIDLSDLSFEHTKRDEFNQQVKMDALADVMKQKAHYEDALGLTLVPVSFGDAQTHRYPTGGARALERSVSYMTESSAARSVDAYPSQAVTAVPNDTSFDEVSYEARLSVYFRIEE